MWLVGAIGTKNSSHFETKMMRRIQVLQDDKDDAMNSLVDLEKDLKRSKDENLRLSVNNSGLKDEVEKVRGDNELARSVVVVVGDIRRFKSQP